MKPYTPETLAKRWECSPGTVRRLCNKGALPCFRLGKAYRITAEAVRGYECGSNSIESGGMPSGQKTENYAVSADFSLSNCNDWVLENVIPKLPNTTRLSRSHIARQIEALLLEGESPPEIWAYFADYDWVAFCQLYGRMVDLPKGFPMFCMDLKQTMVQQGVSRQDLPLIDNPHEAIADARWVRDCHKLLTSPPADRGDG